MLLESIPHSHGKTENLRDVQRTLENAAPFQGAAQLFATLSDDSRIRIFWLLCHREECVVNISALVGMSSPAVSHHLRSLKALGLIDSRRMGKEVHYRAADSEVSRLLHKMVEQVMAVSCPRDQFLTKEETARQVHEYIREHLEERCTTEALARQFHINPTTLKQAFRSAYGTSIAAHMKTHRLEKAAALLKETENSLSEIAAAVGFLSPSRFAEAFREVYGMLPSQWRRQKKME